MQDENPDDINGNLVIKIVYKTRVHCKKNWQRTLQCFTVKLLQRTTVSAIYSKLLFFLHLFPSNNVFFTVKNVKCYDKL